MKPAFIFFNISKFNGIFPISQSEQILQQYKEVVKFLSNKIINKLTQKEINSIFKSSDNYKIENCSFEDFQDMFILYFEQELLNGKTIKDSISIVKTEYNFVYKENSYYCFIFDDLDYFIQYISKLHPFHFIIKKEGQKTIIKDKHLFFDKSEKSFEIEIDYQYKDIDYSLFSIKDIFNKKYINKGTDLNHKLGLYVELSEKEFDEFKFFDTPEREKFFKIIKQKLQYYDSFGICGPYGTGKTISLLRMAVQSNLLNYFYINLSTAFKVHINTLIDILKYEMSKFFGENIFEKKDKLSNGNTNSLNNASNSNNLNNASNSNDLNNANNTNKLNNSNNTNNNNTSNMSVENIDNNNETKYKDFIDLLNDLKDSNGIFEFLKKFITLIKKENTKITNYIILDQYSSKFDIDKKSITDLLKNTSRKIKIIVCSSMNNDSVKYDLCNCLDKRLSQQESNLSNDFLFYFYVGSLIKVNNIKELIEELKGEFDLYLNNFGYLYIYYYQLKKIKDEPDSLKNFQEKEIERIKKDLNKFYVNNKKNKLDFLSTEYIDIIKILNIVNKKNIYFYDELKDEILNLPLKYLEIKREKIDLDDLEFYGIVSNDIKIKKYFCDLEKNKNEQLMELKRLKDDFRTYIKLFNKDKYCNTYISKISENKKKKIKYIKTNYNLKIDIFYLDFLFPLMEDIFSNINYNILINAAKYINNNVAPQSQGGIIEYIINENTKNKKIFLGYSIFDFRTIENFVPNSFFIQNYTSRKIDTLKIYVENKNIEISEEKKDLSAANIYLMQRQFTGKYYDCGLLINDNNSGYKLLLCQVSKKRIASQRYYREEHQIIFNRVKSKLENEYNILIKEGHFTYIFIDEERDETTIEFCKNNNLNYFLFSINKLEFTNLDTTILNDKTFITKDFPFHNSFTILPKKYFILKKGNFENLDYIEKVQKSLSFQNISNNIQKKLAKIFPPKHEIAENDKNEFFIYGNFDEIFEVNPSYCRWLKNDDLYFYCPKKKKKIINQNIIKYPKIEVEEEIKDKEDEKEEEVEWEKIKFKNGSKVSEKNYTLICSKYKIKNAE